MIKNDLKNNKGITMITLALAIVIMVVIVSTLVYNINTGIRTRALNDMYNDVQLLKDRVDIYYSKYGELPILPTQYTQVSNLQGLNVNDNDVYYVIDIEVLDNMTLTYGKGYGTLKQNFEPKITDVYVVNEKSHTIYYVKGIQYEEKTYYTIPSEYSSIVKPEWSDEYTQTKQYTDAEGNIAWIPKGFQVSLKEGETKISEGLVVRNAGDLNEFVWVPVKGMPYSYDRYAFVGGNVNQVEDGMDMVTNSKKIKYNANESNYFTEENPTDEQISVNTYGGYYIARYEAGILEQRTAKGNITQKPIFQKSTNEQVLYVYNYVTINQAKSLSEGLYNKEENNVISKLCSSYAWDTALKFIEIKNDGWITNSTGENYSSDKGGTGILQQIGYHSINNIYDIGGNVVEWTTENYNNTNYPCVYRGGSYAGSASAATRHNNDGELSADEYTGFRTTLYLRTE